MKRKQKTKDEMRGEYFGSLEKFISIVFLFMMVMVFPLYVREQYSGIGNAKYSVFYISTLIYLAVSLILYITKIFPRIKEKTVFRGFWDKISTLDLLVFSYGFFVLLSYLLSEHKEYALRGADGWQMGLISQMMFVGIYFFLSRQQLHGTGALILHLVGSGITFLLGFLHRFQIDPLGMYEGLNLDQMREFLSTMGQATWYSSYICTVFPIGMVLLFVVKERKWRISLIVYNIISFAIIVTQNSDSAFMALAGIFLLFAVFSSGERAKWLVFWENMILMWGTFVAVGIMQRIFADRVIPLNQLSLFFSQGMLSIVLLLISIIFYVLYKKVPEDKELVVMKLTRMLVITIAVVAALLLPALLLFIYWNTNGQLLSWFGYQSGNNYLYFDESWGNNRGLSWMLAWQEYWRMPLHQKLFGVGPDAFSAHMYMVEEVQQRLHDLWGNLTLTNAHNEYLNSLVCYGFFGLISWIGVLAGGVIIFFKKAKEQPLFLGAALCIMGYACHNVFCYQQVCCTPFVFILLGMAESLTKQEKSNTIKKNH